MVLARPGPSRGPGEALLEFAFDGRIVDWRGPAPFFFVAVPDNQVGAVREAARVASYGWGCMPVEARVDGVDFTTSLFPKNGGYLVPLKVAVRRRAGAVLGDPVSIELRVTPPHDRTCDRFGKA